MFFTDDDIRRIKDASTGHLLNVVQDFQNLRKSGQVTFATVRIARHLKNLV